MLETESAARVIGFVAELLGLMRYFDTYPSAPAKEITAKNLRHELSNYLLEHASMRRKDDLDAFCTAFKAASATYHTLSKTYEEMLDAFAQTYAQAT